MICLEKELTICYTSSGDTISRYNSRQTRLLTIYIWLDLFKCRECVYYVHIYKIRTILQKFQHNQSELNNFFKLHYVFFVCNLILYINVVRGIKIPITWYDACRMWARGQIMFLGLYIRENLNGLRYNCVQSLAVSNGNDNNWDGYGFFKLYY